MSKTILFSALTAAGTAGALAVGLATGVMDWPPGRDAAAPERAALPAADAADAARPDSVATIAAPGKEALPDRAAPAVMEHVQELPEAAAAPAPGAAHPSFDLVRAETDGSALVAGAGHPGARLEVLVNGEPAAALDVGADGKFSAFVDLPGGGSVLSLRMRLDGQDVLSANDVIVTPSLPVAIAPLAPGSRPEGGALEARLPDTAPRDRLRGTAPEGGWTTAPDAPEAMAGAAPVPRPGAASGGPDTPGREADAAAEAGDPAGALPAPERSQAPVGAHASGAATPPVRDEAAVGRRVPEAPGGQRASPRPGERAISDGSGPVPDSAPGSAPGMVAQRRSEPSVLVAGPSGVEVLHSAPLAPGGVALDAISYDAQGDVLVSGRGEDDAFVRIYLDNRPLTTSAIAEDGRWRVALPQVDTGTYTLRVDQIDDSGAVIARVESPFLRESAAALDAAAGDGAGPVTSVVVQPGNTLWGISDTRYGKGWQYVSIYRANRDRIRDPDLIYPGQIFDLPEE